MEQERGKLREMMDANILLFWALPRAIAATPAARYATLREIEGRLKSIRNIEKITNTMKIVASTKLTRAQRAMVESQKYGTSSTNIYSEAETAATQAEPEKRGLIIVCSSDKGLCGGVHSGLSRTLRRHLAEAPHYDIVVLGEKCRSQLSRTNSKDIVLSFAGVGKDIPTFADAQIIADQVTSLPKDYSEIKILYNSFINATSYQPEYLPIYDEGTFASSRK